MPSARTDLSATTRKTFAQTRHYGHERIKSASRSNRIYNEQTKSVDRHAYSHSVGAERHKRGKGGAGEVHVLGLLPRHLAAIAIDVERQAHADAELGGLCGRGQKNG